MSVVEEWDLEVNDAVLGKILNGFLCKVDERLRSEKSEQFDT